MSKFSVYYNPEDLEPLYSLSPYNLKRDIKTIDRTELDRIAEEIGNEVRNGINRPRERVCQDDFCKFSKFKYLSAEKSPNISCLHIS